MTRPHDLQKLNRAECSSFSPRAQRKEEFRMDREHVKGTAEKVKGTIKDAAGKATGDKKMQTEGKFDKAKGSANNVAGDIKDAVKQSDE
jgi:uncharacterized protein YjbJ (UPF0337 family)